MEDSPRDMGFARSYLFIALVVCVLAFAHAAHSGSLLKVEDAHDDVLGLFKLVLCIR